MELHSNQICAKANLSEKGRKIVQGTHLEELVGGPIEFTQRKQQGNIKYLQNSPLGVHCSAL